MRRARDEASMCSCCCRPLSVCCRLQRLSRRDKPQGRAPARCRLRAQRRTSASLHMLVLLLQLRERGTRKGCVGGKQSVVAARWWVRSLSKIRGSSKRRGAGCVWRRAGGGEGRCCCCRCRAGLGGAPRGSPEEEASDCRGARGGGGDLGDRGGPHRLQRARADSVRACAS